MTIEKHPCTTSQEPLLQLLRDAQAHIKAMQAVVAEYLPPDSGISEHQAFNELIGLLDGPEQRALFARLDAILSGEVDRG